MKFLELDEIKNGVNVNYFAATSPFICFKENEELLKVNEIVNTIGYFLGCLKKNSLN